MRKEGVFMTKITEVKSVLAKLLATENLTVEPMGQKAGHNICLNFAWYKSKAASKVNTPMVGFGQRQVYTGWFAKAHLILEPDDTPHFHPCLSRQRSMTMSTLKSIPQIFASIPIGPRERVVSTLTELTLRFELPTSPVALLCSVRANGRSIRTKTLR